MKGIRVGNIVVQRIVELEDPFIPIGQMFPDATAESINAHRPWLEPWALCPESGRLILPVQSYLLKTTHHTILIDTCVGNHKSIQFLDSWNNRQDELWLRRLAASGVHPAEIDFVLCTHLHLDHCGWHTQLINGRWQPTFPNAQYLFAREEFQHRQEKADDTFVENIIPVMEAGQGVLVSMDHAIDSEVWLVPTPGHTPGHVSIHLASAGKRAVMMGDVMHSPVQCAEPDWRAVSDDNPDLARATRHQFLNQHAETDTLILTAHFPSPSVGHLVGHSGAFRLNYLST
ncbi:MAG: MBL fold metallo-hydrolase [Burkholderiaceae bacterium]